MTENEKIIEEANEIAKGRMYATNEVIRLQKELEQYRAIGTVEGYERAIQSSIENYNLYREYKSKIEQFEAIGTIEEFKALKEKEEPKKVVYKGEYKKCPNCGSFHVFGKHCTECGQAVDYD